MLEIRKPSRDLESERWDEPNRAGLRGVKLKIRILDLRKPGG
jgi:hypothetical protein